MDGGIISAASSRQMFKTQNGGELVSIFLAAFLLLLSLVLGSLLLWDKVQALSPWLRRGLIAGSILLTALMTVYLVLTILLLEGVR